MGNASVDVTVQPTLWPLWDDAIRVLPDGSMWSSSLGFRNGSAALLNQSCGQGVPACGLPSALASPAAVIAAVASVWGTEPIPLSSRGGDSNASSASDASALLASSPPFALIVLGPTVLVLRAQVSERELCEWAAPAST